MIPPNVKRTKSKDADLTPSKWSYSRKRLEARVILNCEILVVWTCETGCKGGKCQSLEGVDFFENLLHLELEGVRTVAIRRSTVAMWTASLCSQRMRSCNFVS